MPLLDFLEKQLNDLYKANADGTYDNEYVRISMLINDIKSDDINYIATYSNGEYHLYYLDKPTLNSITVLEYKGVFKDLDSVEEMTCYVPEVCFKYAVTVEPEDFVSRVLSAEECEYFY